MTNSSPFKPAIRRLIPPDEYWEMADWHKARSLCDWDLATLAPTQIHDRIAELQSAEDRDGFVFEGELQWLTDFLFADDGPSSAVYGEWVYQILESRFLDVPLMWGAYEDSNAGYVTAKYRDIWCGEVNEIRRHLPQSKDHRSDEFTHWLSDSSYGIVECDRIAVFGPKSGPSWKHLAVLFEKIHNLPYYFIENHDYLTEGSSSFTGLSVIDGNNPQTWEMDLDSEYTDWWTAKFDRRHLNEEEARTNGTVVS